MSLVLPPMEHPVRLVSAGAEDRAADGQDARQQLAVQAYGAVLHQPPEAIPKADDLHAVTVLAPPCRPRGLPHSGRGCRRPRSARRYIWSSGSLSCGEGRCGGEHRVHRLDRRTPWFTGQGSTFRSRDYSLCRFPIQCLCFPWGPGGGTRINPVELPRYGTPDAPI